MTAPDDSLHELCDLAASFHRRGLAFGSTGNLSIRAGGRVWITPTGASLSSLRPEHLALIALDGTPLNGNRASKEFPFHLGAYRAAGDRAQALVHLHSTHAVALSCLEDLDEREPLPVFTPYYLMRVAPLAVVPYHRPGSDELAAAIESACASADSLLLRHHGQVTLGRSLAEAADRAEELEETARLFFLLRHERIRSLSRAEQEAITAAFRPAPPAPG